MEDETGKRVYEGIVTNVLDDKFPSLDHGYDGTPTHRHIWTDSTCWLQDMSGKRVRITIEVLDPAV